MTTIAPILHTMTNNNNSGDIIFQLHIIWMGTSSVPQDSFDFDRADLVLISTHLIETLHVYSHVIRMKMLAFVLILWWQPGSTIIARQGPA